MKFLVEKYFKLIILINHGRELTLAPVDLYMVRVCNECNIASMKVKFKI